MRNRYVDCHAGCISASTVIGMAVVTPQKTSIISTTIPNVLNSKAAIGTRWPR